MQVGGDCGRHQPVEFLACKPYVVNHPAKCSKLGQTNGYCVKTFGFGRPCPLAYVFNWSPLFVGWSFFIPPTSLCSLSSWFTSSCAYHLITVTTFARSHHLSLPIPSTPDLKLISFTNAILHTVVTLIPSGLTSWILTCLATCARLSCILSFRVHVKLCYRIVSYRSVSWSNLAPFTITLWNRTGTFWGYPANRPTDKQTFRTKT